MDFPLTLLQQLDKIDYEKISLKLDMLVPGGGGGGNLTCLWYGVVPFFRVPFS